MSAMSFSYDRYDRRQPASSRRTTFGYWVPLVFTVTVATAGLVAWVWSERRDDDDDSSDADLSYGEDRDEVKTGQAPRAHGEEGQHDDGLVSRVQGIIRRTPSPQQLFDSVSKKTVAGVAAAGAAAGAALASIREEDRDDFGDHSRWSEEAVLRRNVEAQSAQSAAAVDAQSRSFAASVRSAPQTNARTKTVAIVVSAESLMDSAHETEGSYRSETAVSPSMRLKSSFFSFPLTMCRHCSRCSLIPTSPKPSSLCLYTRLLSARGPVRVLVYPHLVLPTRPCRPRYIPLERSSSRSTRSQRIAPCTHLPCRRAAPTTCSGIRSMPKPFDWWKIRPW